MLKFLRLTEQDDLSLLLGCAQNQMMALQKILFVLVERDKLLSEEIKVEAPS